MPEAASRKSSIKSCGKAHPWCAVCRPAQAVAQRKPKLPRKIYELACRNCGRCDACLGLTAPDGMKICRDCRQTKPVGAFARRGDTGGLRNQCIECRNSRMETGPCEACGKSFLRHSSDRTLCARCRPPVTKACAHCGSQFSGSMEQRRYCSKECTGAATKIKLADARRSLRMEALHAYGGTKPACFCCGERTILFLALDHVDGGGHQHRKETGGGGFYTWLRRNNYPAGFRLLCHNCNFGREFNRGTCPHEETPAPS